MQAEAFDAYFLESGKYYVRAESLCGRRVFAVKAARPFMNRGLGSESGFARLSPIRKIWMEKEIAAMTRLECSAMNCMYNEDRYCCKGDIKVEGKDATNASGTCCSSFKERKGNAMSNAVREPSKNIDVDCKACNCVHNKDCKCAADHIGIGGGSNACKCQETECMTFYCK